MENKLAIHCLKIKQQTAEEVRYKSGMNLDSLKIVADNLQRYMEAGGLSQKDVAKKTGVPQRTINHVLNAKPDSNTTLRTLETIADGLKIEVWHLLVPGLSVDLMKNHSIDKLLDNFNAAAPEGRSYIERVAEKEATYNSGSATDELTGAGEQRLSNGTR